MSVDLLLLAVCVVLMLSAVRSNHVDRDKVCVLFVDLLLSAVYVSVLCCVVAVQILTIFNELPTLP